MLPGARFRCAGESVAQLSRRGREVRALTDGAKPIAAPDLAGQRILLVEDSPVVAQFTADLLTELGCCVIGPAPNMAVARELIATHEFDAALVDVHIRGERVFPLCEVLASRGVPFVLTSGYADWSMPAKWQDRPRLQKPYRMDEVRAALEALLKADAP